MRARGGRRTRQLSAGGKTRARRSSDRRRRGCSEHRGEEGAAGGPHLRRMKGDWKRKERKRGARWWAFSCERVSPSVGLSSESKHGPPAIARTSLETRQRP